MSKSSPEGWQITHLEKSLDILSGFPFKSERFTDDRSKIGLIRIRDLTKQSVETFYDDEYDEEYVVRRGDILIGMDGDFNIVKWNSQPALLNQRICKIAARKENGFDTNFLFYSLVPELDSIHKTTGATTVKHLSVKDIRQIEKSFPPLPEQQKIAAILTAVDDVIESTQVQINKLKDLKTAMMQELLTKGIGHTEFKDSPVGRIPKEWEVKAIEDICKLTSGGTPDRTNSAYWNGNIPWIKTGEINYTTILSSEECISEAGLKSSSTKLIPAGSVLMAMYGQGITRGKVAILGIEACLNQACLAMLPSSQIDKYFLFYFFTKEYENLRLLVQEGTQKNLNAAIVKEVLIPLPPMEEQIKICKGLQSIDDNISTKKKRMEISADLKKALMQDLLTGKIRVQVN